MVNYIFGYGSLIEEESRQRTTPLADKIIPIKAKGFKRGWFARTPCSGLTTTFLGCIESEDYMVNGVVYEVSDKELELIDLREKGYDRKKIETKNILYYNEQRISRDSVVWIYVNHFENGTIPKSNFPNKDFPIVQSYVDICINGCFEIDRILKNNLENEFVAEFIKTTFYWNQFWANDRIYPRRPFIYRPNAYEIDTVLKTYLPEKDLFNKIYIE